MFTTAGIVRAPEESARAFAYRVLSFYIRELLLRPGEKLVETDVAHALQVSRTPVHDTFARLERERLLCPVPRGAVVPPLDPDTIRQLIWMYRTAGAAVLGELYTNRPASLEGLERCVAAEYTALGSGAVVRLARLQQDFLTELYRLADHLPVLGALRYTGADLYRLLRMVEDGRDCSEVLVQLSAVKAAINNTAKVILKDHIEHCLVDAVESGDHEAIEELTSAIDRFMK